MRVIGLRGSDMVMVFGRINEEISTQVSGILVEQ
jgi:hypothetical protein